ncbi:MAG: binary toxin-like calcium binding domain-containing protein [Planctomycetota bacterium]|jgi:hypothetical protein
MRNTLCIGLVSLAVACGSGGEAAPEFVVAKYRTLGDLEDAIGAADPTDRDGDRIPDVIEHELGTDPANRDSDFDGLDDNSEIFVPDFARSDPLPDSDRDGVLASNDTDDDGDRLNDGMTLDSDGDGVANYLEYYGYHYDFLTGQFKAWDGNPDTPHFFTDPLQPSTDQDAYPDGMEVSGLLLDPTVAAPGHDPLVAAYPNIVIEVASYSVTLNQKIQISESESLSEGRDWTRQTETTHSYTSEFNWGVGVAAGFEAGSSATGPEGKVTGEVSANIGGAYSNTHSTSTSRAVGESVTSETSWSEARSSNPTDAAHLKLFLKVHNRGTAPISNMLPTLTMKIGGLSVATFEPGNSQVNMLVPGASYPSEPGVYWVVDSVLKGGAAEPLSITLNELRALERGAPLSFSLTQIEGDSMRLTSDGRWESVGDSTEYIARCDAACANLRIDLGNGVLVHHLVYAGDAPSAPRTTLGRALGRMGVDAKGLLSYTDRDGTPRVRSLDGFKYAVDPATLRANGWELQVDGAAADKPPVGFAIADLVLLPSSNVVVRAPRDPSAPSGPEYHFAYLDPLSGEIKVSAADYEGIRSVIVYNEDKSQALELTEDVAGAGFFSGTANASSGFDPSQELHVVITNLAGESVDPAPVLGRLFQAAGPQEPVINEITLNLDDQFLYVNAESGNPANPNSEIAWVRVYHPDLKTTSQPGYRDLFPVINFYEDINGWEVDLPAGFSAKDDVEVVAYVGPGVWTSEIVTPDDTEFSVVRNQGKVAMKSEARELIYAHRIGRLTLDGAPGTKLYRFTEQTSGPHPIPGPPVDLVLEIDGRFAVPTRTAQMHFNAEFKKIGSNLDDYRTTTKRNLEEVSDYADGSAVSVNGPNGLKAGDVYAIRTTRNFYAKIYIVDMSYENLPITERWTVTLKYTVYEK